MNSNTLRINKLLFVYILYSLITFQADAKDPLINIIAKPYTQTEERVIMFVQDSLTKMVNNLAIDNKEETFKIYNDIIATDHIGKLLMSRRWRTMTPKEKEEYTEVFRYYITQWIKTSLVELVQQRGDITSIDIKRITPEINNKEIMWHNIQVVITTKNNNNINFSWRVKEFDDGPQFISVSISGINIVITQSIFFQEKLTNYSNNIDKLIRYMRREINKEQ